MAENVEAQVTPKARATFAWIFKPKADKDPAKKSKYSVLLLFPKGTDLAGLKQAAQAAAKLKWGADAENKLKHPKFKSPFKDQASLVDKEGKPRTQNAFKNVFGQYTAASSIQERAKLTRDVTEAITAVMRDEPVVVESVQIENVDFSDAYEKSVEERMLAEVEVQKLKQNADREIVQAQIKVTQAKAEADAVRLRGEAEAAAISARAKALGENPNLVLLTQAEKWNGQLPTTMPPVGAVPIVGVGK